MANGGNDIIIKGGSAEIIFNDEVYTPEGSHTYANAQRKIVRVVITGDIEYDSGGVKPDGLKCEIHVFCD
ncbi:MAG: hypothetical protein ND895_10915 [Pyrinomonadaceae bacterium]|nr:hypothetical protein [Pyrinomonadaceae bacterium]